MANEPDRNGPNENNAFDPTNPETVKLVTNVLTIQERGKTWRTVSVCVASVLVAVVIAWAIVRIYTHDFWIELFSFLLAPTGVAMLLIKLAVAKARKKFDKGLAQAMAPQTPTTELPKER